jgi:Zn-dependent peptidase ImmA (M78 family)
MVAISRATKMAKQVLEEAKVKSAPVQIDQIAKRHAHVVFKNLPPDVSGMLVPLAAETSKFRWAIVVNQENAEVRQRFTIAHELGHLLLHRYTTPHADAGYKVRFRDQTSSTGSVEEEVEANQFAAELLMPEDLILSHLGKMGFDYAPADTENATVRKLIRMARKFEVSIQALSFRIANLAHSGT